MKIYSGVSCFFWVCSSSYVICLLIIGINRKMPTVSLILFVCLFINLLICLFIFSLNMKMFTAALIMALVAVAMSTRSEERGEFKKKTLLLLAYCLGQDLGTFTSLISHFYDKYIENDWRVLSLPSPCQPILRKELNLVIYMSFLAFARHAVNWLHLRWSACICHVILHIGAWILLQFQPKRLKWVVLFG